MIEEWRNIEGFPDYTVSNLGRVCSVRRGHPIILKGRNSGAGYLQVILHNGDKQAHSKIIHRLVASAFIPNPENKPQVNHISGVKEDNNVNNLEWCTRFENMEHAFAIGLKSNVGIHHPKTHLTEAEVIEIYKLTHTGSSGQKAIGELFRITQQAVSKIKTGRNWKELTASINLQTQEQMQVSIC